MKRDRVKIARLVRAAAADTAAVVDVAVIAAVIAVRGVNATKSCFQCNREAELAKFRLFLSTGS